MIGPKAMPKAIPINTTGMINSTNKMPSTILGSPAAVKLRTAKATSGAIINTINIANGSLVIRSMRNIRNADRDHPRRMPPLNPICSPVSS